LFATGPADAMAIPKPYHLLPHLIHTGFTFLVPAYPDCPGKEAIKWVVVVILPEFQLYHELNRKDVTKIGSLVDTEQIYSQVKN